MDDASALGDVLDSVIQVARTTSSGSGTTGAVDSRAAHDVLKPTSISRGGDRNAPPSFTFSTDRQFEERRSTSLFAAPPRSRMTPRFDEEDDDIDSLAALVDTPRSNDFNDSPSPLTGTPRGDQLFEWSAALQDLHLLDVRDPSPATAAQTVPPLNITPRSMGARGSSYPRSATKPSPRPPRVKKQTAAQSTLGARAATTGGDFMMDEDLGAAMDTGSQSTDLARNMYSPAAIQARQRTAMNALISPRESSVKSDEMMSAADVRRLRNWEAVKRSRERKRIEASQLTVRFTALQSQNEALRSYSEQLTSYIATLEAALKSVPFRGDDL
uniref:BZIP domain-containing protein n=1 Tax=Erythrolobus madagascarensis TaxID=708628 RepID=A0A7S0T8D0_9RHOD|mmetsp:Transcript_483/g.945  ORF Transcript_483/g.945 Transcript_483/m.945 type:complete len:328 (+) Transcript_483:130-1113(+)